MYYFENTINQSNIMKQSSEFNDIHNEEKFKIKAIF